MDFDFSKIKYDDKELFVAIAQDYESGEVLMQAFMNEESLRMTLETGYATYFSRSRNKLWKKGEESGHFQKVVSAWFDCDNDSLLLKVVQTGVACHTGAYSCFFNRIAGDEYGIGAEMLGRLQRIISDRKENPAEGSYTSYLFEKGIDKIAKKAGEEAVEMVIASKNDDKDELTGECADLLYHTLVLLREKGVTLSDVCTQLNKRHNQE